MEALERNHRSFIVATAIMLLVTAALITVGMLLFPLSAYDDPNAGLIRGLINTPRGNIIVIAMFGVLAVNIAAFLTTITRLERERTTILAENSQAASTQHPNVVEGLKASGAIESPKDGTSFKPTKK